MRVDPSDQVDGDGATDPVDNITILPELLPGLGESGWLSVGPGGPKVG